MARPLTAVVTIGEAIGSGLAGRRGQGQAAAVHAMSKPVAGMAALMSGAGSRIIGALNRETAKS